MSVNTKSIKELVKYELGAMTECTIDALVWFCNEEGSFDQEVTADDIIDTIKAAGPGVFTIHGQAASQLFGFDGSAITVQMASH